MIDSLAWPTYNVVCTFIGDDRISYACRGSLTDLVYRYHPTLRKFAAAEVWKGGGFVASAGRNVFSTAFDKNLDGLIDAFLNDWYKANPARSP